MCNVNYQPSEPPLAAAYCGMQNVLRSSYCMQSLYCMHAVYALYRTHAFTVRPLHHGVRISAMCASILLPVQHCAYQCPCCLQLSQHCLPHRNPSCSLLQSYAAVARKVRAKNASCCSTCCCTQPQLRNGLLHFLLLHAVEKEEEAVMRLHTLEEQVGVLEGLDGRALQVSSQSVAP